MGLYTVYLPLYAVLGLILLRIIVFLRFLLPAASRRWQNLEDRLHLHQRYKIPRYNETMQENPLFKKAAAYLSSLPSLEDSDHANIFSGRKGLFLRLQSGCSMRDSFLGARIEWTNLDDSALILSVRINDKRRILRPYLNHIEAVAEELDQSRPELRFLTNCTGNSWNWVPFSHPSTMETILIDPDLKNRVRADLESFLKNKSYYHRLGKVWKRSYLLYGAPGTGKTSFVAAMAKFLSYDVYDLDLGRVAEGLEIKSLLLRTNPKSVIVVEDVDRYLQDGSFAGILGFMEGIFSCCGEERIMVFTWNRRKEEIDPAVMRPGLFDVNIHFPLCDFSMFKAMAGSYLGLKDHKLYPQVEEIFQAGASLSETEIGEIMIANKGSPSRAIRTVIGALQQHRAAQQQQGAAGRVGAAILGKIGGGGAIGRWRIDGGGARAAPEEEERESQSSDKSGLLKDSAVKDFRKFYGLLKMRGGSRKEGSESTTADTVLEKEKDLPSDRPQI